MNRDPLLQGRLAGDARRAIDRTARALVAERPARTASVASGDVGLAIAHATFDRLYPAAGHAHRATSALTRAVSQVARGELDASLGQGLAGVGWGLELVGAGVDGDSGIDACFEEQLSAEAWCGPWDLLAGLAGIGVYALERLPRDSARRLLALVVDRLCDLALPRARGIAWRTERPPRAERAMPPHADWNLGVAHGTPGVLALLARVAAADVDRDTRAKARRVAALAADWVLSQEQADGDSAFAFGVSDGLAPRPSRAAWCYGDPGVAAVLLLAGRLAREPDWVRAGIRIGLRASARAQEASGVMDAGLCHGAAGLAHVFHRMYRGSGDPRFAAASRAWFARTLAMQRPTGPAGGWVALRGRVRGPAVERPASGLLDGAAGIALALSAAVGDDDAAWDRALLLSAPEEAAAVLQPAA